MCINIHYLSYREILFTEVFPSILKKSKTIINTPDLYNCKPAFIGMSNPYAAPFLGLGYLCQLWQEGEFIDNCPDCGGMRYIFYGSGNLGGGISYNRGICNFCKKITAKTGSRKGPSIYMPLLGVYMRFHKNNLFKNYKNDSSVDIIQIMSYLN